MVCRYEGIYGKHKDPYSVIITDIIGSGSDSGDVINKEPDHRKYIDAFRDGDDNPHTDLDDKAKAGDVTDPIQDLYRIYLEVGPESSYQAVDVLFVIDSSTSMSGWEGYDATDILGNYKVWRCWALDTMLTGQISSENSPGSNAGYSGSGTQSSAQHQRIMHDNGLIAKLASLNPENKVAIAEFSKDSGSVLGWMYASTLVDEDHLGKSLNSWYTNSSGTNYVAGMIEMREFLEQVTGKNEDGNKKIVIFISDGLPTYYYTSLNPSDYDISNPSGSGKEHEAEYNATSTRITEFKSSEFISGLIDSGELELFSIGVGLGNFDGLEEDLDTTALLKQLSTNDDVFDSTNFLEIMKHIETLITGGYGSYTNLKITDTLSAYVDFYSDDMDLYIERIENATGKSDPLYVNGNYTTLGETIIGSSLKIDEKNKSVSVEFANYKEDDGYTFRISYNVKTTQKAYDEYSANIRNGSLLEGSDGYNGVKGMGTTEERETDFSYSIITNVNDETVIDKVENKTSSGMPGFHSNDKAVLEYSQKLYEVGGVQTHRVEFLHPVVQVWTCDLKITKEWGDDTDADSDATVTVNVMMKALPEDYDPTSDPITYDERTGGTRIATVTLTKDNNWTATVNDLPKGYFYYIVEDTTNWPEYSQIYTPYAVAVPHDGSDLVEFAVGVKNVKSERFIELVKTDMSDNPLVGAEFELYADAQHQTKVDAGLIPSGDDGVFTPANFSLEIGEYYLTETVTPPNYNSLTEDVRLVVTAEGVTAYYKDSPLTVTTNTGTDGTTKTYTIKIPNSSGYDLPETGGSGILPYTLCGMLLMAAAVYIYVSRRKSERRLV